MRRYLILLLMSLLLSVSSGCALKEKTLYVKDDTQNVTDLISPTLPEKDEEVREIIVEIKGAVLNPGVYQMNGDSRLHDLYWKAGGGTESAELRTVNLAMHIEDGQSFYIPEKGEELLQNPPEIQGGQGKGKINLNTATREELMSVTGIGPSTADNILAYREETGRFTSVEDLLHVNRIGEKTLDKIRDYFTVK
ncbi:helix-hairpin-helix domain-containing protein [Proteiniclasticum ruminis]|uniref:Competence protein ComEA n=1 Tax=Proteiniclasticum ruminis TaxID=398199 RepID=A0A1I4XWJ5_9CLOT|nr:helix-hairpin-helix domain-containing protein [Proteiniclasticum ruminis]SFN30281.1 competence protein ComEA [Proteiniclasticum ruminis]